jgi:hypothetical protein
VVITADNRSTAVIAGVPIADSTSIVPVSADSAPINLSGSGTNSIAGTVVLNPADDDGAVAVAAMQSLLGGPRITVKSQVPTVLLNTAQVGDYHYELTLPIGAPALGQFNGVLPITLTDAGQSMVAGVYTAQGAGQTATLSYQSQIPAPAPVSIVGGDATQSFTLIP